ncbi:aminoglycoside phosphotransferase family protein [Streptomyces shenzhenensis]|uniref:Phosphotransferase enzyme family protein n=1 Tax=Streptomyces shenzhenensis TaxID=943815 RepID=A0A3M0I0D1_9ACTN|nr:aminoglycoside phosphotransferase family protein [Streptomyces shenzhenensis]RMB81602.1 phosphotransferase enzyme family protein [Streptomyces shenzhenensis]
MGAPPLPHRHFGESARSDAIGVFVDRAADLGQASSGHHNQNYVLPLAEDVSLLLGREAGTSVTVRIRRADALPVVIRTWQDEAEILGALRGILPHVPECLAKGDGYALHSYVEGIPLSSVCDNGKPVDALLIKALVGLLAQMAQVRREVLPPLPAVWPRNDKDSQGFLQTLAHLADRQIRQPNWREFGGLLTALGIPEDALIRLAERVPAMARRPYSLLHADLHRDNLIMSYSGLPPLICVDWELATYGDPLHDLATHLVRMQYPAHQWGEVIDAWADAMRLIRPAAVNGLGKDLRHYIAFERAQSVYPDVMRAADRLQGTSDQKSLDDATTAVRRALEAAAEPLRLRNVPGELEIERILFRWRAARNGGLGLSAKVSDWNPDLRAPEHPDFPRSAVRPALFAEGAASASRVFKGTGHLNSVVRVPGIDFPVVVRRKVANVCRRERGFLSEHAVLRAIELSRVGVSAPKFLALGTGYQGERFAIHTYEGPRRADQPPNHPVHGLLPHEADRLVDQLGALTQVNYKALDPAAGEGRFYSWLCDQLVLLVGELPKASQQLARLLGLPDADRLRQILARHTVSHREPALLHGDLNPWNLVRREDALALTLIDWEMAVVGDPLYDLVRHMHLTPTRPEIRDRMFRRWEERLPERHTVDWLRDWRVYRWIEIVRSAYVDLDRLVTGASLDAPNVRRAVDSYAMTLAAATGSLGLPTRATANPYLARALA